MAEFFVDIVMSLDRKFREHQTAKAKEQAEADAKGKKKKARKAEERW